MIIHFTPPDRQPPLVWTACGRGTSDWTRGHAEPVRVRGCDVCVAAAARYAAREGKRLPVGVTHVGGA